MVPQGPSLHALQQIIDGVVVVPTSGERQSAMELLEYSLLVSAAAQSEAPWRGKAPPPAPVGACLRNAPGFALPSHLAAIIFLLFDYSVKEPIASSIL